MNKYDGEKEYWVQIREHGSRKEKTSHEQIDRKREQPKAMLYTCGVFLMQPRSFHFNLPHQPLTPDQEGSASPEIPDGAFANLEKMEARLNNEKAVGTANAEDKAGLFQHRSSEKVFFKKHIA